MTRRVQLTVTVPDGYPPDDLARELDRAVETTTSAGVESVTLEPESARADQVLRVYLRWALGHIRMPDRHPNPEAWAKDYNTARGLLDTA